MKPYFKAPQFLLNWDMFAARVPSFNFHGQDSIKTTIGTCMSMAIICLTLIYALLKLQHMLLFKNPDIIEFTDLTAHDASKKYSLTDNDFIAAISVENWTAGPRVDPRYIQFVMANDVGTEDGKITTTYYPMK